MEAVKTPVHPMTEPGPQPARTARALSAVARPARTTLTLLGAWGLRVDRRPVRLPRTEFRLLANLAVRGTQPCQTVAETLWPEESTRLALQSLSSAQARLRTAVPGSVRTDQDTISLGRSVRTDVAGLERAASTLAADPWTCRGVADLAPLASGELLPGWSDAWVLMERARLRAIQLKALRIVAHHALDIYEYEVAVEAATFASSLEPCSADLAETIIAARIGLGDIGGAAHSYRVFRQALNAGIGTVLPQSLRSLRDDLLSLVPRAIARQPQPGADGHQQRSGAEAPTDVLARLDPAGAGDGGSRRLPGVRTDPTALARQPRHAEPSSLLRARRTGPPAPRPDLPTQPNPPPGKEQRE